MKEELNLLSSGLIKKTSVCKVLKIDKTSIESQIKDKKQLSIIETIRLMTIWTKFISTISRKFDNLF